MRAHPIRLVVVIAALGLMTFAAVSAMAAPNCSGEACEALTVSADGCAWQNSSAKAVRFQLLAGSETLVSTVLPPGSTFRETDKKVCISTDANSPRFEASFAMLRQMPDAPDFSLKPKPQAAVAPGAAAAVAAPVAAATPVAPKIAVPRAKPQQLASTAANVPAPVPATTPEPAATPATPTPATPTQAAHSRPPKPRAKPDMPGLSSASAATVVTQPTQPVQMVKAPSPEEIAAGANPCGDACSEILFTRLDDCIWVQSQNPRPIMFQATVAGHMVVLVLEGANAAKANASASTKPPEGAAAYHTRLHDPFVSTSDGIPVYRARLGEKGACAADRTQISQFVAVYKK